MAQSRTFFFSVYLAAQVHPSSLYEQMQQQATVYVHQTGCSRRVLPCWSAPSRGALRSSASSLRAPDVIVCGRGRARGRKCSSGFFRFPRGAVRESRQQLRNKASARGRVFLVGEMQPPPPPTRWREAAICRRRRRRELHLIPPTPCRPPPQFWHIASNEAASRSIHGRAVISRLTGVSDGQRVVSHVTF